MIDKDRATALLAREIGASVFVCATDADAVYLDWGKPEQRAIRSATPDAMDAYAFPAGSMGPKVEAAQDFARATGGRAIICALADVPAAVRGEKGTTIANDAGVGRDRLPLRVHDVRPRRPARRPSASPRRSFRSWRWSGCSASRSSFSATLPPRGRTRWRWSSARSWRSPSPGGTATRSTTCATRRSQASPPACRRSSSCCRSAP